MKAAFNLRWGGGGIGFGGIVASDGGGNFEWGAKTEVFATLFRLCFREERRFAVAELLLLPFGDSFWKAFRI